MADEVIIRAEGLGKKYVIGHQSSERYTALRDVMARATKNFARTTRDMLRGKALVTGDEVEEFWALKNVSFEIKRGDVLGIIGRNGAGKSTLLKVLSRITEPTEGRVTINGRLASLLEVGTGFHPELTGRENIYLNGAILGMTRGEVTRKFDEIVDFAGVERFLDTPVKRYSSGMYVRLAFAVAAHLEPEILVVDEVLAVGDSEFQKKCLGKMKDVAGQGRTVLFVSHNLGAVQSLCNTGALLSSGRLTVIGSVSKTLSAYRTLGCEQSPVLTNKTSAFFSISEISHSADNRHLTCVTSVDALKNCEIAIHIHLRDANGVPVLVGSSAGYGIKGQQCTAGSRTSMQATLPLAGLASGHYSIAVETFDVSSGINATSRSEHSFMFEGAPVSGATHSLKQSWGIGSFQILLESQSSARLANFDLQ